MGSGPRQLGEQVLAANTEFYRAFKERDFGAMETVWSNDASVACIHPGWSVLRGRELVMGSWRSILNSEESPGVECSNTTAHILGDVAFVVCEEHVTDGVLMATNIFVRERAGWKMVHHQASPIAADVLEAFRPEPDGPLN